jgi:capsular polysaccharide biosynthesis protein
MGGMISPEIGISEAAAETSHLEASEPLLGLSRINLGDTIADPSLRHFLGTVHRSQSVRRFTLRDVTLHGPTMVLFSGGRKLRETRYQVPDKAYQDAGIADVIPLAGDTPVVIGFNMDWWGYYHWLAQCLPAIDWAFPSGARLALPKLEGWHAELLELLGYAGVERIEIDQTSCYAMPHAVYSEHLNGSTAFAVSRGVAATFQHLRKRAAVTPAPHDIIYIARSDVRRRPLRNEQALIQFLQSEGVAIVVPGELKVVDQIALFSGAKLVIGPHGGGLTNIGFCQDQATVYELLPSHYPNPCFNRLAQTRGLDYWADVFPSDGQGHEHHQTWEVDLEVFKRRFDAVRNAALPKRTAPGELFAYYQSSAHTRPIHKWHHYFEVYERYLARFRHINATILEIGVEQGGGLEMWRAYLGPSCRLFGIDEDPNAKQLEGIANKMFIGDVRDRDFLRSVLRDIGRPDVVINDGAHTAARQITAFEECYPALSDTGVYIVEDTHTSLWGGQFADRPDGRSLIDIARQLCTDLMGWTGEVTNFAQLGTGQNVKLRNQASEFCRNTKQISFFDSMIVFERGSRDVPRHEVRGAG